MARQTVMTREALEQLFAEVGSALRHSQGRLHAHPQDAHREGDRLRPAMAFVLAQSGLNAPAHCSPYGTCLGLHAAQTPRICDEKFTMCCDARRMARFDFRYTAPFAADLQKQLRKPGRRFEHAPDHALRPVLARHAGILGCRSATRTTLTATPAIRLAPRAA